MDSSTGDAKVAPEDKEKWMNTQWRPASEKMEEVIAVVLADVVASESRQRAIQARHYPQFECSLTGLICAVAEHWASGEPGWLYTTRSRSKTKGSRYRPQIYSASYPKLQDELSECGWIDLRKGDQGPESVLKSRTTLRASPRLRQLLTEHDISFYDFQLAPVSEVIELRTTKDFKSKEYELVEYSDTDEALKMRAQMDRIHAALLDADIVCIDTDCDDRQRTMKRIFNNSDLSCAGRLYGGFWQPMSDTQRLEEISINGEDVAILDYDQMSLAIAYGLSGLPLPEGDLYLIDGLSRLVDREPRPTVKQVVNAMFNRKTPLTEYPKGVAPLTYQGGEEVYPARWLAEAIREKHAPIADWFEQGRGLELQRRDSDIAVDVLLKLIDDGIVALPVHDAFIVPLSKKDYVRSVMIDTFQEHIGGEVKVSEKLPPIISIAA
ncbi:hypothetical protein [Oceanicaulis sp.]|uniref:hypothetical protein n=1 Tax=Oceanicaulis sp. TaxID=1924941 RepID=UPI003D271FA4